MAPLTYKRPMSGGRLIRALAMAAALSVSVTADAATDFSEFDEEQALGYSQAAIGRTVNAVGLVDRQRRTVSLDEFRGKPLVISMVYTSCYHTCPMITQALERSVASAQDTFGKDGFSVLSIGFDTAEDTPERMRAYANERGIDFDNWRFVSSTSDVVQSLSETLGFIFFPSPKGFDHLAQTTLIDGDGKVYAQIYGEDFPPPALVEPMKRLVYGTSASVTSVSGIVERIRLFCTIYDPRSDRYRFDYSIFIGLIIGGLSLAGVALVIGRNAWRIWGRGSSA